MDSPLHSAPSSELPLWLATASEPFDDVSSMPVQGLLDRIGDCPIVLLQALLEHHGEGAKIVVWAHNSHLGDSDATDMSRRGEYNLGHLYRHHYGEAVYSFGFGTDHGTVVAVSDWDEPQEIKTVQPALEHSYEALCHHTGASCFVLYSEKEAGFPASLLTG